MAEEALVFLTFKPTDVIFQNGGTSSWALNLNRARKCRFALLSRNAKDKRTPARAPEPHHQGFMVGKISDVTPAPDDPGDWLVEFSEFAEINFDELWKGDRNPVRYAKVEDLEKEFNFRFDKLDWQPMPPRGETVEAAIAPPRGRQRSTGVQPLTMADAKAGLALTFGVSPEAVEITIRG